MRSFHFALERVLAWRRTELELAELRFQRAMAELAAVDRALAELEAAGVRAEIQVRDWSPLCGSDLAALGAFRLRVRKQKQELTARRAVCAERLATERKALLEARLRLRLLERLKQRRWEAWRVVRDREIETLAAESCLVGFGDRPAARSANV